MVTQICIIVSEWLWVPEPCATKLLSTDYVEPWIKGYLTCSECAVQIWFWAVMHKKHYTSNTQMTLHHLR